MLKPVFCEITAWWNWYYIRKQISTHFFYYPVQLMIEKGFNVEVLTVLHPEREEPKHENHHKFQIHRFVKDDYFSFDVNFFSYLMKRNYSLIHLHEIDWRINHVPWIVSRIKNTPMVFTSHSGSIMNSMQQLESKMSFARKSKLKNLLLIRDSPTCVFIAFTKCQADSYKKLGIKNIRLIPHGIDPKIFETVRDNKINEKYGLSELNMLCVGTWAPWKGQHFLVKSMPKILKEFPNTKLLLAGRTYSKSETEYLKLLKSLVNRMDLNDKVLFLSDPPRSDLIQLYLLSSMLILPTEAEMSSLVFLEAMAAGLPIISTDKPHIREILGNGEAGILVEREQTSIENAILRLLGDSALRKRLGSNGKKEVEKKYRIDRVIQQYWDLYQSLIGQNK